MVCGNHDGEPYSLSHQPDRRQADTSHTRCVIFSSPDIGRPLFDRLETKWFEAIVLEKWAGSMPGLHFGKNFYESVERNYCLAKDTRHWLFYFRCEEKETSSSSIEMSQKPDFVLESLDETAMRASTHYSFTDRVPETDELLEYHQGTLPVSESWPRQRFSPPSYTEMAIEVIPRPADILNHSAYY